MILLPTLNLKKLFSTVLFMSLFAFMACGGGGASDEGGSSATDVPVTSVMLNKTALSLSSGESFTLTATVYPFNATNKALTWNSDNPSVATVSSGVVNGVSKGSATITVITEDGNYKATCVVDVAEFITVEYNELDTWLSNSASSDDINYIRVINVPASALKGNYPNPGALGQRIKNNSSKRVFLKIGSIQGDYSSIGRYAFYEVGNLVGLDLSGCTALTGIGTRAFSHCSSLASISIGEHISTPWSQRDREICF